MNGCGAKGIPHKYEQYINPQLLATESATNARRFFTFAYGAVKPLARNVVRPSLATRSANRLVASAGDLATFITNTKICIDFISQENKRILL